LRAENLGSQPPVAYRALEFLHENGFVHKIEKLNAYVACLHPSEAHSPAFIVCRQCRFVTEAHSEAKALRTTAIDNGFKVEHVTVEAIGLCSNCADTAP